MASVFSALMLGSVSTPALASPEPTATVTCGPDDVNYVDADDVSTFTVASGDNAVVSGDAGVTLAISRSTTFSVGGSISNTSSISASLVVATVSDALGVTITSSYSGTSSSSGSWTVPDDYTNGGRLEIGALKHSGEVQQYQANPDDCSNGDLVSSAAYDAPETGWFFKHVKI